MRKHIQVSPVSTKQLRMLIVHNLRPDYTKHLPATDEGHHASIWMHVRCCMHDDMHASAFVFSVLISACFVSINVP